jgi:TusA-related sulfurtransferase
MKCPRPIIEIAKLARKEPGSVLHVKANDLAFESDVNAWVDNSGASIVNLEKEGDVILVQIQLAE